MGQRQYNTVKLNFLRVYQKENCYFLPEVAKIFGKHPNTIINWSKRGVIGPGKKMWNQWYWLESELIDQYSKMFPTR